MSKLDSEQRRDQLITSIQDELDFIARCNRGSEWMSDESVERIHAIAQRRWRDSEGVEQAFLTAEEVENLCIRKGTLLPDERKVINHHIVATIEMLEQLPFPKHLRNVPEIAGGHHERMDGRGYPKGLRRERCPFKPAAWE